MKTRYGVLTKSDRAITAEEDGLLTYSRLDAWQKRAVKAGAVLPCEWHHTGAAANKTNYYDPEDFAELNPADFPAVKVAPVVNGDLNRLRISISYKTMVGGFTRHATSKWETIEIVMAEPQTRKDGYITGADGRRLRSNNESVTFHYKAPRARKFRKITLAEAEQLGYRFAK
ncbi:hypothetical protein [Canibacter oris]|uniref:Uncharacterized protein n=1 Tax=Canibacter oris TaxID=1365628 RepID=A0A840DNM4_9MICO|nr:hypothetical protein [Canibacter oris]MBB4071638.1 hypothetical protein [Canibacter oris]